MDNKKIPVITINREYAAGGSTLAAMLSEKLNIPYYDKDFVKKTMEESGFDEADVEREDEELSRSSLIFDNFLNGIVSYSSSHDKIFEAEKKVILQLAGTPCIMVGRCADNILKEAGIEVFSIYLHSPIENRIARAEELKENGDINPDKFVETRDEQRSTFYKQYTGHEIYDASNYTICFDTGRISFSRCADIVAGLLQDLQD